MPSFRTALVLAGGLSAAAVGAASAQPYFNDNGGPDYGYGSRPGLQYAPGYRPRERPAAAPYGYYEGRSTQEDVQREYGRSGTLGREGLGADPRHPKAPATSRSPASAEQALTIR